MVPILMFPELEAIVFMYTSTVVILAYNGLCFIRELYNMKQQKWHYLVDPSNLVSWNLYICSSIMVSPTVFGQYMDIQVQIRAFKFEVHNKTLFGYDG